MKENKVNREKGGIDVTAVITYRTSFVVNIQPMTASLSLHLNFLSMSNVCIGIRYYFINGFLILDWFLVSFNKGFKHKSKY